MSRVHDMGGRFGDGPVIPEPEDEVFHEEWHKRALAVTLACGSLGQWNIDVSRHMRECLDPVDYTRFSYYEIWAAGLANLLVDAGVLTREELASGAAQGSSPLEGRKLRADKVAEVLAAGGPADRPSDIAPTFQVGDRVRTRQAGNLVIPGGHTRLPGYAQTAEGRVVRYHGTHILPDSSAHRQGDAAEPLYAVAIAAKELWLHPEHPNDEVVLDLWQSYLEPVA
ncbi:MAG: nitrile hydratase subunit beta [Rhodobacteraceae bacterium]|nr:nitrile hydratase subunit beta [Paracoccaceae bacterium]